MARGRGAGAALLALAATAALPRRFSRAILRRGLGCVGSALTLGMSKNRWTAGLWRRTAEPLLIRAIEDVVFAVQNGLIPALLSDDVSVTEAGAAALQEHPL